MTRKTFFLALAAGVVFSCISPGVVPAQEMPEADFAEALAKAGFFDLAIEQCNKITSSSKSGSDEKVAVEYIKAIILKMEAERYRADQDKYTAKSKAAIAAAQRPPPGQRRANHQQSATAATLTNPP